MKLTSAHARLLKMNQPVFRTADAAAGLGIDNAHASKVLERLAETGQGLHLARSLWVFPAQVNPLTLPEYLTAPWPSYISLQSALYYHGMISQIPAVIYAVSPARTRRFTTPLGTVSIHHLPAELFDGYTVNDAGVKMATPEKALVDVLYLRPARSRLFCALPELEWPKGFKPDTARRMIARIASHHRRNMARRCFEELWRTPLARPLT